MKTGPSTIQGKAISSMNAMKYGLTSQKVVLPGEDAAAFERLRDALFEEHQPATTEALLVDEMAQSHWRLQRVRARQDEAFEYEQLDAKLLTLLHRYATGFERTFSKSLDTLKKLQHERLQEGKPDFVSKKAEQEAIFKMLDEITAPPPLGPEMRARLYGDTEVAGPEART